MELLEIKDLPADARTEAAADATHAGIYGFLGRTIRIAGNDPEILTRFNHLYEAFRLASHTSPVEDEVLFRVEHGPGGTSLTVIGRNTACISTGNEYLRWPSILLNRIILSSVRSHFIFHAGAVSRNNQGLVITGNSGMGKSTMVSHLVRRGFAYLSDEVAPVERGTGMLDPFPVRLGLRPGPGQALIGDAPAIDMAFSGDAKKIVDASILAPGQTGTRVPLRTVIFLTRARGDEITTSKKLRGPVSAAFSAWTPSLAAELENLPGAHVLDARPWHESTEVLLRVENLANVTQPLRDLAARHGTQLLHLQYEDFGEHDYDTEPALTPISPAMAVIELIKKMPPHCRTPLIADAYDGKASRLAEELGGLVHELAFYRLTPGRLEQELDLVTSVAP